MTEISYETIIKNLIKSLRIREEAAVDCLFGDQDTMLVISLIELIMLYH